jgi:hypothetical protein
MEGVTCMAAHPDPLEGGAMIDAAAAGSADATRSAVAVQGSGMVAQSGGAGVLSS